MQLYQKITEAKGDSFILQSALLYLIALLYSLLSGGIDPSYPSNFV